MFRVAVTPSASEGKQVISRLSGRGAFTLTGTSLAEERSGSLVGCLVTFGGPFCSFSGRRFATEPCKEKESRFEIDGLEQRIAPCVALPQPQPSGQFPCGNPLNAPGGSNDPG